VPYITIGLSRSFLGLILGIAWAFGTPPGAPVREGGNSLGS